MPLRNVVLWSFTLSLLLGGMASTGEAQTYPTTVAEFHTMCDAPGNNWWGAWTGQNNVLTGPENEAPGTPWPAWPRTATSVQLPSGCGTFLHNLMCTRSATLETNLEFEFWRIVANIRGNDVHLAQLEDWVARVEMYLGYKNTLGIASPTHVYGGFNALAGGAGGPAAMKGRLTMLLAFAETAIFAGYDVGAVVQELYAQLQGQYNGGQQPNIASAVASLSSVPGLLHLIRSIVYADIALKLLPSYQNAVTMLYGIVVFMQWAIDGLIVNVADTMPGLYEIVGMISEFQTATGITGLQAGFESQVAMMDDVVDPPCEDAQSCLLSSGGTEGLVVGAFNLAYVDEHMYEPVDVNPAWVGFDSFADIGLYLLMGKGTDNGTGEGWGGSYPVAYPTHANAVAQNGLVPAPFKRIGALLAAAEMAAKAEAFDPANAGNPTAYREVAWQYLCMARQLGQFQNYPWQSSIDAVFESLYPGADNSNLVDQWLTGGDTIGAILFPLPQTLAVSGCSNCHFGGSMPHPDWYTNLSNLALGIPPNCGDGHLDEGEVCDDGNIVNGDSCNSTCSQIICNHGDWAWLDPETGTCYWIANSTTYWITNTCENADPNGHRFVSNDTAEYQRVFDNVVNPFGGDPWVGAWFDSTPWKWKWQKYIPEADTMYFSSATTNGDDFGTGGLNYCGYWSDANGVSNLKQTSCAYLKRHLCERPRPGEQ